MMVAQKKDSLQKQKHLKDFEPSSSILDMSLWEIVEKGHCQNGWQSFVEHLLMMF